MTYFINSDHALRWATEVLRFRRFPKINPLYREIAHEKDDVDELPPEWCGETKTLPIDADERFGLAMKVYSVLESLPAEHSFILRLHYWGDYITEKSLKRAIEGREAMRQKGLRTRLNYRYSFRQIADKLKCDRKAATRKIRNAQHLVEEDLLRLGLIAYIPVPDSCLSEEHLEVFQENFRKKERV